MSFTAAVVTVSDKGSRGEREDNSGDTLERLLKEAGAETVAREIVADEIKEIAKALRHFSERGGAVDLIVTTGGTGLTPRDVTPEATLSVIERQAPGFAEAIRAGSMQITPRAMLSRAVSGIRGCTLILNFPGSPKACEESFAIVRPALGHALEMLGSTGGECAR
ncbi:MAG: MogA/MoaB family molybdenum cofactor biosynthesis protein [Thermoleophilia bacterium]|nr:MogA/MoaB family molybdenum cofactor biosynthesis protein [Thermoleophilia bacterium]